MAIINRKKLFDGIRQQPFPGKLNTGQVEGVTALVDEFERRKLKDLRHLAYILATAKWETAHTMQPIREYGRGKGRAYGRPDSVTGKVYYGRGYVQLTWKYNYQRMMDILGKAVVGDLVNNPELALEHKTAAAIIYEGMLRAESFKGDFTGKALEDYTTAAGFDWVNARKIVNGLDHARDIAGIAKQFYADLVAASE